MALLMADPARYAPDLLGFYPQERQIDRRYEVTGINPYSVDESTRKVNALLPISYAVPTSRQGSEALMQRLGSIRPAVPSAITDALSNMADLGEYFLNSSSDMTYEEMKERSAQAAMDVAGGGFGSRVFMNPAYDAATVSMSGLSPARKQRILREVELTRSFDPNAPKNKKARSNQYGDIRPSDYEDLTQMPIAESSASLLMPEKKIDLQSIYGKPFMMLPWDKSSTARQISQIGDMKLSEPVTTYGGIGYMRYPQEEIIASTGEVIKRLRNKAIKGEEKYEQPILAMQNTMGGSGIDFATFTTETFLNALPQAKISSKNAEKIDGFMRAKFPDWVGINSPKLREHLMSMKGTPKGERLKRLDSATAQDLGVPNISQIRYGLTDDILKMQREGLGGFTIGQMNPTKEMRWPDIPHPTYGATISGDYLGGLLTPLPDTILYRDFIDSKGYMDDAGNYLASRTVNKNTGESNFYTPQKVRKAIELEMPIQTVDEQMLEEADFYINSLLGRY